MLKKYSYYYFAGFFEDLYRTIRVLVIIVILSSLSVNSSGQGIGINNSGVPADPSAILDVKSSSMGFLVPRLSAAQLTAFPGTPAQSLIIYNTTTLCFEIYIGTNWLPVVCKCTTVPATPGTITPSNASPTTCSSGVTYSITPIATATNYNWSVPSGATITAGQGTSSITVTWGSVSGSVSVSASNSCGSSGLSSLSVTLTNSSHGTASFSYTGSLQTWTVPTCVASVTVIMQGAGGGSAYAYTTAGTGGGGALDSATVAVSVGEVFNIYLGQQGHNSTSSCDGGAGGIGGNANDEAGGPGYGDTNNTPWYNLPGWGAGGGGGGASSIRIGGTALSNTIIVSGGGGGAGSDYNTEIYGTSYGAGGSGGQPATAGAGYNVNERGKAGTATAGGAAVVLNSGACTPSGSASTAGGYGYGGDGGMAKITCEWGGGGGGGGGYYGGSGGCGGGGGGGYSYMGGSGVTAISDTPGSNTGNGTLTITW